MKILTAQQIRDIDQRAIKEFGISSLSLMQKAGEGLADAVAEILADHQLPAVVAIVVGKGNNGGDGLAAALSLAMRGIRSNCIALFPEKDLSKDARHFYRKSHRNKAIQIINASTPSLLHKHASSILHSSVVVDAVLGTGFQGKISGIIQEAIDLVNAFRGVVVAADIPSGLDATTGQSGKAVMADLTVTMGFCKTGFLQGDAMNYLGALRVVDIGIPMQLGEAYPSQMYLLDKNAVGAVLPRRHRISHKGNYGHLLIVAGSLGMTGAAILCARAALRAGSGLATVACPKSVQPIIAAGCAEAMTLPLPDEAPFPALRDALDDKKYDAIVMGPGIGRDKDTQTLIIQMLMEVDSPMVLDADALFAIAANRFDLRKAKSRNLIMTPHLGEFSRLTGKEFSERNKSLWVEVTTYSVNCGVIVVFKSHITAISNGLGGVYFSIGGNPGMATAGMGDALSGIIGSFLGQGLTPLDAATAGVYLHARAGDLAAKLFGFYGLIASDVIDALPRAIMELPLPRRVD